MQRLHQIILTLEMAFIVGPISFFVTTLALVSLFNPIEHDYLKLVITMLGAISTWGVWHVTMVAIKAFDHQLQPSSFWWALVMIGIVLCTLILVVINVPELESWLDAPWLSIYLFGLPLLVPAVHSMYVFRYTHKN